MQEKLSLLITFYVSKGEFIFFSVQTLRIKVRTIKMDNLGRYHICFFLTFISSFGPSRSGLMDRTSPQIISNLPRRFVSRRHLRDCRIYLFPTLKVLVCDVDLLPQRLFQPVRQLSCKRSQVHLLDSQQFYSYIKAMGRDLFYSITTYLYTTFSTGFQN